MWDASVPEQMGPAWIIHAGSPFSTHGADPKGKRDHLERQTGIPEVTKRRQPAKEKQQRRAERSDLEKQRKAAKAASDAERNPRVAEKAKGSTKERNPGE